jgi:hypothetical protein
MIFFAFPEDARWNDDRDAVEFTVLVGEYEGTVRVARRVIQRLLDQSPTPHLSGASKPFISSGPASSLRSNGS